MYSSTGMPSCYNSGVSSQIPLSSSVLLMSSTLPRRFQVYDAACVLIYKYLSKISLIVSSVAHSSTSSWRVSVLMIRILRTYLVNSPTTYRSFSHQGQEKFDVSQSDSGSDGGTCKNRPVGHKNVLVPVLGSTCVLGARVVWSNQCVISVPAARTMGSHSDLV